MSISELEGWINEDIKDIRKAVDELTEKGKIIKAEDHLFHIEVFNTFKLSVLNFLREFHRENPFKDGLPKEELKTKLALDRSLEVLKLLPHIGEISLEGNKIKLKSATTEEIDPSLEEKK